MIKTNNVGTSQKSDATNIDQVAKKSDATNIDQAKSDATNSNNNVNKGHTPTGNVPELSNQSNLLDSVIDLPILYSYFNAVEDWQKHNIDIKLKSYKSLLIKYLLERSHYTKGTNLYQFPHDKFKRKTGLVKIYGSGKREYLAQVINKLFNLYTLEIPGTNFTQKVSLMKLNFDLMNLVKLQETDELLVKLYGDVDITDTSLVDITPINIKSLEAYLKGNENLSYQNETIKNYNDQAQLILAVAKATNGVFPQIINESDFGRRYYKGKSLQNTSSVVRKAALGTHYEYDLNAAVYAIKLNICAFLTDTKFTYTSEYLEYKQAIRKRLSKLVFGDTTQFHTDIIKQALTAIGFGAKNNGNGYYDDDGTWKQTSLQDIFSYKSKTTDKMVLAKTKFDSFINDPWIVNFINEQSQMTDIITAHYKDQKLVTKETHQFLVDGRNSINKNRLMAYVFQSIEREIMNSACEFIEQNNVKVLLRVHDAIYTDKKVDMRELHVKIQQDYQSPKLSWAGTIIRFEEQEAESYYYDDDDESDIEAAWERLTGVKRELTPRIKINYKSPKTEGYQDSKCDYGQTEYDPSNDPYVQQMNKEEREEHYRILGYTDYNPIHDLLKVK